MPGDSRFAQILGGRFVRGVMNRGFHAYARRRCRSLNRLDPISTQETALRSLVRTAQATRFGRDHGFAGIRSVDDYQKVVPIRTYDEFWSSYFKDAYPVLDNSTWPGQIPFFALTSGTTQGATKFIPVSQAMIRSNLQAARTMLAAFMVQRPESRLFQGRLFFLGGSTNLEPVGNAIEQGDLSGIAARTLNPLWQPYTFPPVQLALEPDWEVKLDLLANLSQVLPITLISGVPCWLLSLFEKLLDRTGHSCIAEVWPNLELVIHGGVRFEPYRTAFREILGDPRIQLQESYPCSEGFIAYGDPATGMLRLCVDHGLFYEFVPVEELDAVRPTRHWLGTVEVGRNYAIVVSTCAGLWSYVIGDTVRIESVAPPLITFTGRTKYTLSAFGEHLIGEEVEAAVTVAADESGGQVRDWHVGPVFLNRNGHHVYVVEFYRVPRDLRVFRNRIDAELAARNADYRCHRARGVGLPLPALLLVKRGGLDAWLRVQGKLGGQHKFPRMDNDGQLTAELVAFLRARDLVEDELPAADG